MLKPAKTFMVRSFSVTEVAFDCLLQACRLGIRHVRKINERADMSQRLGLTLQKHQAPLSVYSGYDYVVLLC